MYVSQPLCFISQTHNHMLTIHIDFCLWNLILLGCNNFTERIKKKSGQTSYKIIAPFPLLFGKNQRNVVKIKKHTQRSIFKIANSGLCELKKKSTN